MGINDLVNRLQTAIAADDQEGGVQAVMELLRLTLTDLNRIAEALEQIAANTKKE